MKWTEPEVWNSDMLIPVTGLRYNSGRVNAKGEPAVRQDLASLVMDDLDDDPDWDGMGGDSARWPLPWRYQDLDLNGPQYLA